MLRRGQQAAQQAKQQATPTARAVRSLPREPTDRVVTVLALLLLLLAYGVIHRARFPRRLTWPRALALARFRRAPPLRKRNGNGPRVAGDEEPVAWNPHIAWSEPSSEFYSWTFFAALLAGLVRKTLVRASRADQRLMSPAPRCHDSGDHCL